MADLLLYNATIINEGKRVKGYVAVDGNFISLTGEGNPPANLLESARHKIDLSGCYLLPGVIDDHVHFRDPGLTHKGDVTTESQAAVAGGVTSYMEMPNTKPPTVTIEALNDKIAHAAECSSANYCFFLGATKDNIDELLRCDYSTTPGVKLFLGSSTGNMLVDDEIALNRIFAEVPALIAVHTEDEGIIRANRDLYERQFGGNVPINIHPYIRSREACLKATHHAIDLANTHGSRLHVMHVSTADEVKLFSNAPIGEKRITAEACVHHLWFTDDDYASLGARIKINPAIKQDADRQALRKALRDGRIDIIATDHAPHLLSEKEGTALTAASGAPMVQFSLPAMLELADCNVFTHELVVEKMCHAPARLYNIDRRGYIRPGFYADLVVVKPNDPYIVTDSMVASRCGWTPLAGVTLSNRVITTFVNGAKVYDHGIVNTDIKGQLLRFNS